jgi:arsenate reductase
VSDASTGPGAHVYWLPHCSTCQKAVKHLHERGVRVDEFRDLKGQPLQESEVRELARKVGGVEALFSRRAMKYRQMGLHEREVGEDEMVRLMTEEYTFVTRPVIVLGDRATAGSAAKRIDALVGGAGA